MRELQRLNRMDCSLIRAASAVLCPRAGAQHHAASADPFGPYRLIYDAISKLHKDYAPGGKSYGKKPQPVPAEELTRLTETLMARAKNGSSSSRHDLCEGGSVGYRRF